MRRVALPIDFKPSPDGPVPVDESLYWLAMEYCSRELAEMPKLHEYAKVWLTVCLDKDDKPVSANGITVVQNVVDAPIFRSSDSKSAKLLSERIESFCADRGLRGSHVFIYLNSEEKPEQRCPAWKFWLLKAWRGRPADRFLVRVR